MINAQYEIESHVATLAIEPMELNSVDSFTWRTDKFDKIHFQLSFQFPATA